MKKLFFSLFFVFLFIHSSFSQSTGTAYLSYADILQENGITLQDLNIVKRTLGQIATSGGGRYKIQTPDKTINKKIKKGYVAVLKNDSLFINLQSLKYKKAKFGGWYAPAIIQDGHIYFVAHAVSSDPTPAIMFGAIGGAIQGRNLAKKTVYYELSLKDKTVTIVDKKNVKELFTLLPEPGNEEEVLN